jgi:hypothetical protein
MRTVLLHLSKQSIVDVATAIARFCTIDLQVLYVQVLHRVRLGATSPCCASLPCSF